MDTDSTQKAEGKTQKAEGGIEHTEAALTCQRLTLCVLCISVLKISHLSHTTIALPFSEFSI